LDSTDFRSRPDHKEIRVTKWLKLTAFTPMDWKEKTDKATGDTKKKMQEELDALEAKRKQLVKEMDKIKDSTKDTWLDLKTKLDKDFDDLKAESEKAKEKFK
jgi:hypothetical protein